MQGRPLLIDWRAEDTAEALKARYLSERDVRLRSRLHGLWLVRAGWPIVKAAGAVGVHRDTVGEWVRWYRDGGVAEVLRHTMAGKGKPSFLSAEQERELVEQVSAGRFRTAGEIRDWIESEYGVVYTSNSVYGVLNRLGCSRRVPRPRHEKADAAGAGILEKRGLSHALAEAGVTPETVLGFADEMRVGLRGMVRRVWGRRGVKVVQRVQLVYRWMYLFLVVDGRRGRLSWTWIDSMRSEAIASAVRGLRLQTDLGALVWDGARGHRAEEVERVGLPTIVQPPYSPELNPAERVFEEVRRWVEGRIYRSIEDKMEAVNAYLRELESDPARVRSLAGWAWIDDSIRCLPAHLAAASQ